MKGIVDAADGGKELKGGDAGGGNANANVDAGHLFAGNAGGGASADQAGKAAAAVNAVSGEQILKAIVDAAEGEKQGEAADAATNPISAAIGTAGAGAAAFGANGGMNRNDKIAAAIVLRGMAKDGKFAVQAAANGADGASVKSAVEKAIEEISKKLKAIADAAKAAAVAAVDVGEDKIGNVVDNNGGTADKGSVNGIAKGMKGIVDASDGGKELKGGDAGGAANAGAGNLFAGNAGNGASAEQAGKAAAAVNAVSGEQILKAIVDAAGGAQQQEQEGQGAGAATNPISAAIGAAQAGAAAFGANMNGNDKIAAAIVLRGMAKNGKFAVQNADGAEGASVKSAIEKAIEEISKKLKAIADAAKAAAAVDVNDDKIGNVVNNGAAAGTADAGSVKGIAKGMNKIVDASDGGKELKGAGAGGAGGNGDAGNLFAGNAGGASAEQAGKAAAAVNAVSGEQILKAIVDAAGGEQQEQGQGAGAATNPISAAIGTAGAGANFANAGMNGNDKIAAAIVLRGMAKNGKFAVQDGAAINAVSGE